MHLFFGYHDLATIFVLVISFVTSQQVSANVHSGGWNLKPKTTAIVTGGTKGIGHAIVTELGKTFGCHILTCARNETELAAYLKDCKEQNMHVEGVVADVSTKEGLDKLMEKADKFIQEHGDGTLDILVNNVGTNIRKPTIDYTEEDLDFILRTNLKSMYELTKRCHPYLKRKDDSKSTTSVVNIGSVAGVTCMKSGTPYAATKAAMNQLTGNWACEWGPDGIRVNCVTPWYINTPLAQQVLKNEEYARYVYILSYYVFF